LLVPTNALLQAAQAGGYAVGAFNVYNLEGARAVVAASEVQRSPAMLQVLPKALDYAGLPLVALCLSAAREAAVPVAVQLDHASSATQIGQALEAGLPSVMADGSHLPYAGNAAFTLSMAHLAHKQGATIEAELGRLTGTEDGLTVPGYEARLTGPAEAARFVAETGVDALAVCVGNVHGHYRGEPRLDLARLAAIRQAVAVPLVLHGASGLPENLVREAIDRGVCKLNVNTELREAYLRALKEQAAASADLLTLLAAAADAMEEVVSAKLALLGSVGRA
jgi:tagatose 1,6-diphosphate aldolase GatY/KbaY